MSDDPFNLQRFVDAQQNEFAQVLAELKEGRKRSHWMWFVFPQWKGLGRSPTANFYAVSSRAEAEAYSEHPIIGPRLLECTNLANLIEGRAIQEIFGSIDAMKFHSCMTLFAEVVPNAGIFRDALDRYFAGQPDRLTLDLLSQAGS